MRSAFSEATLRERLTFRGVLPSRFTMIAKSVACRGVQPSRRRTTLITWKGEKYVRSHQVFANLTLGHGVGEMGVHSSLNFGGKVVNLDFG